MTHIRVFTDSKKEWRWSKIADNGEIVATSGEGYKNKLYCLERANQEAAVIGAEVIED